MFCGRPAPQHHAVRWGRRRSCAYKDAHSSFLQATRAEIIFSVTLRSLFSPSPITPRSSSPPPLKDNISNLSIPLMPPLLLLKIFPLNQIHQLALTLLLLFALASVKPRKLDLSLGLLIFLLFFFSTLCTHSFTSLARQVWLLRALSSLCVLARSVRLAPSLRSGLLVSPH